MSNPAVYFSVRGIAPYLVLSKVKELNEQPNFNLTSLLIIRNMLLSFSPDRRTQTELLGSGGPNQKHILLH